MKEYKAIVKFKSGVQGVLTLKAENSNNAFVSICELLDKCDVEEFEIQESEKGDE